MISKDQIQQIQGGNVVDSEGAKIGAVGQVYLDDRTEEPAWVTANTGLFGTKETFIPLDQADIDGDNLRVPYTKDRVKDAPKVEVDEHLDVDQEQELYRYYGLDYAGGTTDLSDAGTAPTTTGPAGMAGTAAVGTTGQYDDSRGGPGQDTSGPSTDDAMTRSEERLDVGTEQRETGRARLRKYVTTEQQTTTVPVSREEVRVEREPITDANRDEATSGPGFSDEEHEVVLTEERPVVSKEEVPVERVRLDKEQVTGEEQVSEDVRKEHIETEREVDDQGRRP